MSPRTIRIMWYFNFCSLGFVLGTLHGSGTLQRWVGSLLYPECRDAPAIVQYRSGMTLCPGQMAIGHLRIEIPQTTDDEPKKI